MWCAAALCNCAVGTAGLSYCLLVLGVWVLTGGFGIVADLFGLLHHEAVCSNSEPLRLQHDGACEFGAVVLAF